MNRASSLKEALLKWCRWQKFRREASDVCNRIILQKKCIMSQKKATFSRFWAVLAKMCFIEKHRELELPFNQPNGGNFFLSSRRRNDLIVNLHENPVLALELDFFPSSAAGGHLWEWVQGARRQRHDMLFHIRNGKQHTSACFSDGRPLQTTILLEGSFFAALELVECRATDLKCNTTELLV